MVDRILQNDKALFLAFPAIVFIFPHIFLITGGYDSWIMPTPREAGYVENATALLFLLGGIYGIQLARREWKSEVKFFRATLLFVSILSIWVCLEEVSYGQQFLHFDSPKWFQEKNFQKETNIHNLSGVKISHTLKTVGYIGVGLAGILLPIGVRITKTVFPSTGWFYYFIPTIWMIVPSFFHLFANLPKNIAKSLPDGGRIVSENAYFAESGEYEEYMLAVWVIIYIATVHRAVLKQRAGEG